MDLETPDVTTNQKGAHATAIALVAVAATAAAQDQHVAVALTAVAAAALLEAVTVLSDAKVRKARAGVVEAAHWQKKSG